MSFFKDFKDDLSQAVNELIPGEELPEEELDASSEMMVNTLEGELDIESELSKLDGLLEPAGKNERVSHVELPPEEPVLEQVTRPEPRPVRAAASQPRAEQEQKAATRLAVEPQVSQRTVLKPAEDLKAIEAPAAEEKPKPVLHVDATQAGLGQKDREAEDAFSQIGNLLDESDDDALPEDLSMELEEPKFSFPPEMPPAAVGSLRVERTVSRSNDSFLNKDDPVSKKVKREQTKPSANKEEIPMSEEMTKETTMSLEDELSSVTPEITDEVSIITEGTTIKGNLSTTGSFSISGNIEGNVQCNGKLEVTGTIKGNSSSSEIFADAAKIEGEIVSTGTVKIGLGSVVVGNITATSAVIAGAVKGDIDVQGPVVVDTSAVIVGNIKSRSVQINNGAVIEGFCSQCYADIDVENLFGEKKGSK